MKSHGRFVVPFVTLALFGFGSAARAGILGGSFSGEVTSGIDTLGLFGTPGASLVGENFIFSFAYNTSAIATAISGSVNGSYVGSSGNNYANYYDNADDGAVSVSITIGDYSLSETNNVSGSYSGISYCNPAWCGGNEMIISAGINNGPGITAVPLGATSPNLFPTPATFTSVTQGTVDSLMSEPLATTLYLKNAGGVQEIVSVGPSPEPDTWVCLTAGIGLIAMRSVFRRRGRSKFPVRAV